MLPRPVTRPATVATLAAAITTSLCLACADGTKQAGAVDASSQPTTGAVRDTTPRAPTITVDSLTAAQRATAMDSTPLQRTPDSATLASRAPAARAPQDTTPRKVVNGMLGPSAGLRHMAFRDAGSNLDSLWPVKAPAPLAGSILPAKRVIAFYGNPLSKRMGILGEFASEDMLRKLDEEVAAWTRLDPEHPAQPALHLIVLVADGQPGTSGKYRTRHDSAMVEKVYGWAKSRNALLFLDLQVGQSTLQYELPWVEKFLIRPDVHLGIDPEFSMKNGGIPGKKIGTYDAVDVNYASRFLAGLVKKHNLPPKILVLHRFTPGGITNAKKIVLDPSVQVVMHMDGFGPPWMKRDTYWRDIKRDPVQYAGWKQFTKAKNDRPPTPREDILRLWPTPLYIQIQ